MSGCARRQLSVDEMRIRVMQQIQTTAPALGTFEFVRLRLADRCIPAVEIIVGDYASIDELPDCIEPEALRDWLKARGLAEIGSQ